MSTSSKLKDPRVCRIFFSSPFGGMEDEREELTRKYFPQIHHLCNSHGVQFVAVDMRWGITKEAGENAQVINICLRELDRSDMFVGFFGQRYGWHGDKDELLQQNFDNAIPGYPWLENYRDKSVTELEYLHGHLNSPGSLPSCIYFRDKAYDDKIKDEGIKKGDKKTVFKYSAESELSMALMDELKLRVQATNDKLLDLDLKYPNPFKAAEKMFNCIWKHLNEVLLKDTSKIELSPRQQQVMEHDAFLSSHLSVYSRNSQYFHQLNSLLGSTKHLLVTGVAGSGKTALLCNWIDDLKTNENIVLFYHLIGSTSSSTKPVNILDRIIMEFAEDKIDKQVDTSSLKNIKEKGVQQLLEELQVAMGKINSKGKQAVIIIDGLDKLLQGSKTEKPLFWLPSNIPENIHFILSTIESDKECVHELTEERKYDILKIEPLDKTTQHEICTKSLLMFGKELSPDQLQRVIDAEPTHNPLFLKITISEIVVFGYFRLLDEKIDSLIKCNSVEELFENFLQRLEKDYNVDNYQGNLVKQVMVTILVCNEGISEQEVKEIFTIPDSVWSPLYFAIDKYVVQHSGLLKLGFTELQKAVKKRYLMSDDKSEVTQKLIYYFENKRKNLHHSANITDYDVRRCSLELPFLQQQINDKEGLVNTVTDITIFKFLYDKNRYELLDYWLATDYPLHKIVDKYLANFDVLVANIYLERQELHLEKKYKNPPGVYASDVLDSLRIALSIVQERTEGIKIMKKKIKMLENSEGCMNEDDRQTSLIRCQYFLASLYVGNEDYKSGEEIHHRVISKLEKLQEQGTIVVDSLIVLAMSYNDMGVILINTKQFEKAEEYFLKSLQIEEKIGIKEEIAEGYMNVGTCKLHLGDHEKSLATFLKVLKMYEEIYFGELNHEYGALLTNIGLVYRRMNNLEEAEKYYNRSLKIKANALGLDHPDVSFVYMNLSVIEHLRNDVPKALEYMKKAEEIHVKRNADLRLSMNYRKIVENRLLYMIILEQFEEAEKEYQLILDILLELDQMSYCLPGVHREMVKYYIRSEMNDKAMKSALAILDHPNVVVTDFVLVDHIDNMKPFKDRPIREYKHSLERAFELWPQDGDISRRMARSLYIPGNEKEKLLKHLLISDKNIDGLADKIYSYAADWCKEAENEELQLSVLYRGHEIYPDSMELISKVVDILKVKRDYANLLDFLRPVVKKTENTSILFLAGYCAMMQAQFAEAKSLLTRAITTDDDPVTAQAKKVLDSVDGFEAKYLAYKEEEAKKNAES